MPALDALDRARTLVIITVSPLEEHGPHLPLGVDAFTARHFAELIAGRLVSERPGWSAVLTPTLHLGSFTFEAVGTVTVRQRVVRDVLVDYGASLARARLPLPPDRQRPRRPDAPDRARRGGGHRVAPPRRDHGLPERPSRLGLSQWPLPGRRGARARPAPHGGRAQGLRRRRARRLVGDLDDADAPPGAGRRQYRDLPPATYSLPARLRRNYPLRDGGQGYVGHPAMAEVDFAKATTDVLVDAEPRAGERPPRRAASRPPAAARRTP